MGASKYLLENRDSILGSYSIPGIDPPLNPSKNVVSVDKITTRFYPKKFTGSGNYDCWTERGMGGGEGRGKFFESFYFLNFPFFSGRDSTGEPVHF